MNVDAMVTITSKTMMNGNDFLCDSEAPAKIARKKAESANENM